MALILRKTVLPRNVSYLKSIKGRPLATTSNKKSAAPLSKIIPWRELKDECKLQDLGQLKFRRSTLPASAKRRQRRTKNYLMRFCKSCPNLIPQSRLSPYIPPRHFSPPRTKTVSRLHSTSSASHLFSILSPLNAMLQPSSVQWGSKRAYSASCNCGCPCPFPCGPCGSGKGCNCLPPPCNTPPRCIQYMTGYYYYPYGWWFCGPYHVTGTCSPVGPCPAGGPSEPCKCPAACICPDTSAIFRGTAPTSADFSNNVVSSPLPTEGTLQSRKSGPSKYHPYNSPMKSNQYPKGQVPMPSGPQCAPKKPLPPFMSALMCFSGSAQQNADNTFNTPHNMTDCNQYSTTTYPQPSILPQESSNTFSDINVYTYNNQFPYYERKKKSKSPIYHKRPKRYISDNMCPNLKQPRVILTREQRDKPRVKPDAFDYYSIPNYKSPYPPQPFEECNIKAYGP